MNLLNYDSNCFLVNFDVIHKIYKRVVQYYIFIIQNKQITRKVRSPPTASIPGRRPPFPQ